MKYFTVLFMWLLHKAVYRIMMTRAEYPRMKKEYAEGKVWISKPNRFTNAVSGKVQVYQFLSNEYRPFAINFVRGVRSFMELEYKMVFYPDLVKTGSHMPEPGSRCDQLLRNYLNYTIVNMTPDDVNYPQTLPFPNFMLELSYWHGTVEMGVLQFYATLDRDAVIREQYT